MGLLDDVKGYIMLTFGEYSAAKIDVFAKKINPDSRPREFLDLCVDFLATMLGKELAMEKMKPYYEKYAGV